MLRRFLHRFRSHFRKRKMEQEIEKELRFHLEMETEKNIGRGMNDQDARHAAQRAFGGVEQTKEFYRDLARFRWIEDTWNDLRYGLRMFVRNPMFTLIAMSTLALGIGANTAIFSVVNAVLVKSLPYNEAQRLVSVNEYTASFGGEGSVSYLNFIDWRTRNQVFETFGVYNWGNYNLSGVGEAERLIAAQTSADLFSALRVGAALGRVYTSEEDSPGASPVVVLSHTLWKRRFGGDPNVLGRALTLNDRKYIVIGVMPQGFSFPHDVEMWIPVGPISDQEQWKQRINHMGLYTVARLKPGVTIEQARADMKNIAAALEQQYPDSNQGTTAIVNPLREGMVRGIRRPLYVLLSAVGFVLLIACANVASLMLARAAARQKEIAVRAALGARPWRLVQQLLTESLLLALAGGGLGLLVAYWGIGSILAISPEGLIPRIEEINLDLNVLLFTAVISILTGVVFGLAPALQLSRSDVQETLKATSRSASGRQTWLSSGLVVTEIALTIVLLVGAGLLIRSFARLQHVNPGFETENRLRFRILLPEQEYPDTELDKRINFFSQVREKIATLPGVQSVGLSSGLPLGHNGSSTIFTFVGQPEPPLAEIPSMEVCTVDIGYFQTLGIPLVRGRFFNEQDNRSHLKPEDLKDKTGVQQIVAGMNTIIIDEEFARRYFSGRDPLGQKIRLGRSNDPWATTLTIVGVVGRVKMEGLRKNSDLVQGYFPFQQSPWPLMTVTLRTQLTPDSLIASVRREVEKVDPNQPIFDINTLEEIRSKSIASDRLNLTLLGVFAAVALTLALVGVYGVVSWMVSQRKHEIGVRMALGARTGDVLRLVLGQGIIIIITGVGIGLAGAFALTRLIKAMLFEVSATDPTTFIFIAMLLAAVALLACFIPARRAAKVDPVVALRAD
jgi:predicted permease